MSKKNKYCPKKILFILIIITISFVTYSVNSIYSSNLIPFKSTETKEAEVIEQKQSSIFAQKESKEFPLTDIKPNVPNVPKITDITNIITPQISDPEREDQSDSVASSYRSGGDVPFGNREYLPTDIRINNSNKNVSLLIDNDYDHNTLIKIYKLSELNKEHTILLYHTNTSLMYKYSIKSYYTNIFINRLNLKTLSTNTPLQFFINNHRYNKLKRGKYFQNDIKQISVLLLLYNNGGIYVNLNKLSKHENTSMYILSNYKNFNKQSNILHDLMSDINNKYDTYKLSEVNEWPLKFSINYNKDFGIDIDDVIIKNNTDTHYGILSYNHRVCHTHDINAGDESQTFSGLQFIPFIDTFIDRDIWTIDNGNEINYNNQKILEQKNILIFLNAWYGASNMIWPPLSSVQSVMKPLLLSMHFGPKFHSKILKKKSKLYFTAMNQAIGARDSGTYNLLLNNNIETYFSGDNTLLFTNPYSISNNNILIIDVNQEAIDLLIKIIPKIFHRKLVYLQQNIPKNEYIFRYNRSRMYRYYYSNNILSSIAQSKMVITSRIHCALPSVAMNVSVIFINSKHLPGGDGNRTEGLTHLFHTINTKNMTTELSDFDWFNPPQNPNFNKFIRLRASQWYEIRKFNHLYENAQTFGVIPYTLNHYNPSQSKILFIQIYTKDDITL
eukprot:463128_1